MTNRVLLLIPTTSYRTQAFLDAARRIGVEITVASEHPSIFEERNPAGLMTLNYRAAEEAVERATQSSKQHPINAVAGVDDQSVVLAAMIAQALGLDHNSVPSVSAARNKFVMRQQLAKVSVSQPGFTLVSLNADPHAAASRVNYPCILKPLTLAASRGVIRADSEEEFVAAFHRIAAILRVADVASMCHGEEADSILAEEYIPGKEVALEGLLLNGELRVLALFDKPDPLEGPFFEETIYATPSRLPKSVQDQTASCAGRATRALGLREGPVHAELRVNENGPWLIEVAARSIGGYCSRALRFVESNQQSHTITLEELILRHALEMDTQSYQRESPASGVMMIPIPSRGILDGVKGLEEAKAMKDIEDVVISAHLGEHLIPLPEGGKYLGFIFSRAETSERVEAALREAHRRLGFVIATEHQIVSRVQ